MARPGSSLSLPIWMVLILAVCLFSMATHFFLESMGVDGLFSQGPQIVGHYDDTFILGSLPISGMIGLLVTQNLTGKKTEEPLQTGVITYDYRWPSSDSSRAVTTVKPREPAAVKSGPGEYEITAGNNAFTVRLSVVGKEVESARLLEVRFHGQTQVTVYRDRVVTAPQTPGWPN